MTLFWGELALKLDKPPLHVYFLCVRSRNQISAIESDQSPSRGRGAAFRHPPASRSSHTDEALVSSAKPDRRNGKSRADADSESLSEGGDGVQGRVRGSRRVHFTPDKHSPKVSSQ
jgi:hypothetical protein